MVLTHVNAWYYTHAKAWLSFFTLWGASICYVTFVFAYGIGYGKQLKRKGELNTALTIKRLGALLLGYYFVASWLTSIWEGGILNLKEFLQIIFFINLPSYTEFLPTFVFFGLLLLAFQKPIQKLLKQPVMAALVGVLIYALASYLYQLPWNFPAGDVLKGLLVGIDGLNRWGILSYFPVFLWGTTWGSHFDPADQTGKLKYLLFFAGVVGFFALIKSGYLSERWPPSIAYLLWGLSYSLGVLVLWPGIEKLKKLAQLGIYLGRNAFDYFIWHTIIIISSVAFLIPYRSWSEIPVLLSLAVVLTLIAGIIPLRLRLFKYLTNL